MPYEVCYRALLSISVVEGLKPHTHTRDAPPRAGAAAPRPLQPLYYPLTTPYRGPRSPG